MFRIRREQFEEMERAATREFHERAAEALRAALPEATADCTDDQLRKHVADSTVRAAKYQLVSEAAVSDFAFLLWLLGDDFETDPDCSGVVDILAEVDGDYVDDRDRTQAAIAFVDEMLAGDAGAAGGNRP